MNQVQILRKMTGEERLKEAFRLSEIEREKILTKIKKQLGKKASKREIMKEFAKRVHNIDLDVIRRK